MLEATQTEVIDKGCDRLGVVLTGDANELYVLSEFLLRLCDRRCDSLTMWSPRSPEPQNGVLGERIAEIDLAARDRLHDRRRRCRGGDHGRRCGR